MGLNLSKVGQPLVAIMSPRSEPTPSSMVAHFSVIRFVTLLLKEKKITPEIVQNMRTWEHSGFSIDTSVRLDAGDHEGLKRLSEYISRSPS